ncbi:MAG: hypothetical protein N2712_02050 [Brevinematales bacterium]|nr:hypothetical protein [Brevinematales bacterium]
MKKFLYILIAFVAIYLSGCQMVADFLVTKPESNQPVYGTFLRPGEDPGFISFSNSVNIHPSIPIIGTVLASGVDPAFDDNGYGNIAYGTAYRPGIYDVNEWKITADANYIYVYLAMRSKQYGSEEVAKNNGGWLFANVAIFFGKTNSNPTVTNVGFHSPNDGAGTSGGATGKLSARLFTTNIQLYYGAAVIGPTKPNSGGVWIVNNFWTTSPTNRLASITTNDIFKGSIGFLSSNTTIAFRIPRVGDLTNSGEKWWVFIGVQGWEDYGLDSPCPTVNGHLRDIIPLYPDLYNFAASDGNNTNTSRFVDIVVNNPVRQSNIIYNRIIDASDMIVITLP